MSGNLTVSHVDSKYQISSLVDETSNQINTARDHPQV